MSTIIKMLRRGAPHKPFWRIVVTDSRRPHGCIEQLGVYDNLRKPAWLDLDEPKTSAWLAKGALPSPSVKRLFIQKGLLTKGAKPASASR